MKDMGMTFSAIPRWDLGNCTQVQFDLWYAFNQPQISRITLISLLMMVQIIPTFTYLFMEGLKPSGIYIVVLDSMSDVWLERKLWPDSLITNFKQLVDVVNRAPHLASLWTAGLSLSLLWRWRSKIERDFCIERTNFKRAWKETIFMKIEIKGFKFGENSIIFIQYYIFDTFKFNSLQDSDFNP